MKENTQPTEQPIGSYDGKLEIHSIWLTMQGEGPDTGTPAVFIRLAGCNLRCPLCDTDYTSKRELISIDEINDRVYRLWKGVQRPPFVLDPPLIVLTGGEPFRQDISDLVMELIASGYRVQIETNGTLPPPDMPLDNMLLSIVCSPKGPVIHSSLMPHIDALKYVIEHSYVAEDGLPIRVLGRKNMPGRPTEMFHGEIFVQPMDEQDEEKNKLHLAAAVHSCMTHGYRLSIQTHKITGMP